MTGGTNSDTILIWGAGAIGGTLGAYLARAGQDVLSSVGAYQLEGAGIQLFDKVEGHHSTILGLPLLPLLAWLRQAGLLAR